MRSLIATLHLRRPRHHGQDDLGSRAIQVETVGNGHEINAGSAKLLDELERVADPGAREPVEAAPQDVELRTLFLPPGDEDDPGAGRG